MRGTREFRPPAHEAASDRELASARKPVASGRVSRDDSLSYAVKLSNAVLRRFCADSGAEPWLASLAWTLRVRPTTVPCGSTITFVEAFQGERFGTMFSRCRDQGLFGDLPRKGWRGKKLHFVRFWHHPASSDVICEVRPCDNPATNFAAMADAACVLYHGLAGVGAIPIHAALLEHRGRGLLLVGEGGVGKTTCCQRVPGTWTPLSDDEALILPGSDGEGFAHPFPTWSAIVRGAGARYRQVEYGIPLSAVFFLSQSSKDGAAALGRGAAAARMTSATLGYFTRPGWKSSHPEDEVSLRARVFDNACKIASRVPSFELGVSLHGSFWNEMKRVLPE